MQRIVASVQLIKAVGGGWDAAHSIAQGDASKDLAGFNSKALAD